MRLPDWKPRLTAYLAEIARRPMVEGQHDCALFAAGAVEAMTGEDLARGLRGRYRTTRGGLRVLRRAGYDGIPAFAAAHFPQIHLSRMAPGDLVIVADEETPWALGIAQGEGIYVLKAMGLGLMPASAATHVFAVR